MDAHAGVDLYTALLVAVGQGIEQVVAQVFPLMVALSLGGVIILAALLVAANALTCRLYAEGYVVRAGQRLWELLCDDEWQRWLPSLRDISEVDERDERDEASATSETRRAPQAVE